MYADAARARIEELAGRLRVLRAAAQGLPPVSDRLFATEKLDGISISLIYEGGPVRRPGYPGRLRPAHRAPPDQNGASPVSFP